MKSTHTFHLLVLGTVLSLALSETSYAQWCNSPACTNGTNWNNIENAGVLTPTTSRQVTNKYTGGSCGGGTEHKIYYTFSATAGRTYVFDLGGMGIDGLTDNEITIYNGVCASGATMASGVSNSCDNNAYVEWTCAASGTYYVVPQYGCGNFSECMNVRMGYYYLDLVPGCTAASFFDNGGAGGSGTSRGGVGTNNGNYFQGTTGWARTYTPANPANKTHVTFSSFATEAGVDLLYVYDGNSTGAPQVAGSPFSGSALPGGASGITSTAADGSLTFRFVSNGGLPVNFVVGAGWNASISAGAPVLSAGPDLTICNGQNTTLSGTGGTYNWSPSTGLSCTTCANPVANPTVQTTYTLSVTSGCGTTTDEATVFVNNVPAINAGADKSVCPGAGTTLNGSGGAGSYSWSPSTGLSCTNCATPVATPGSQTTYTVTSTNGCGSASDDVTVSIHTPPTANAGAGTTLCSGQSVTLNGSGGGTYNWAPSGTLNNPSISNPTASPTVPTSYTLVVTDGNGCTDVSVTYLDVSALPAANASPATICSGQNATITATGGGTYSWNTGATTSSIVVSPSSFTTYSVTVTSPMGCTVTTSASVSLISSPSANISGATSVCSGAPVTLTASGGGTYSWTTGETTAAIIVSQTSATTYSVIVGSGGCADTAATTLAMYTMPTATITTASTNVCTGTTATLTASGGGTYTWNTGSTAAAIAVSPTSATSYTVTVTNSNGCTDTDVITLNSASTPAAAIAGNSTICSGQAASLTASGGGTYTWSTGATTASISVSPTSPATYSVIVAIGSCTAAATSNVAVNPTPSANINVASTSICAGTNATLTAAGGGAYSWNTGSTAAVISVSPTIATSYTVTVSNGLCTSNSIVSLTVNTPPFADINAASNTICSGTNAILNATGGGTYLWNTGETTASIAVAPATNTTYSVVVSNGICTSTASQLITVNTSPTANAGSNISVTNGNSAVITATGGGTYLWSTGETTSSITVNPGSTTTYTVVVTNANGCTDASAVTVFVKFDCGDFFIPTAFSPNNDLHNDVFYVHHKCLKAMHLMIYDRWGRQVFVTDDITKGWDGIYNEEPGEKAVYCYIVQYELITGDTGEVKGNVTLMK